MLLKKHLKVLHKHRYNVASPKNTFPIQKSVLSLFFLVLVKNNLIQAIQNLIMLKKLNELVTKLKSDVHDDIEEGQDSDPILSVALFKNFVEIC